MWNLIASADKNWGIGQKNQLLVRIPSDLNRFREMTVGNVVVMGRKTLESLPGGMALQGRTNVVLTKNRDFKAKNVVVIHDVESLIEFLKEQETEVYVIGGESIYRQLLEYCDTAYITRIDHVYAADAYLPNLDKDEQWKLVSESDEHTYFDLEYTYTVYKRNVKSSLCSERGQKGRC